VPADLVLEVRLADAVGDQLVVPLDLEPPPAPLGLVAVGGSDQVSLVWERPPVDDLLGYDVYRGDSPYGPFTRLNPVPLTAGSRYVDAPLPGFTTFHYSVAARDSSANRSPLAPIVTVATGPPLARGWPLPMAQEGVAAVVTADLDGLPGQELVTAADAVYVWHADGSELIDGDQNVLTHGVFSTDGQSSGRGFLAAPAIADLDGDGGLDIIAAAWDAAAVYAWSAAGATAGSLLPGWPQPLDDDFNWSTPVVDDLDLDGDYEVLAVSGKFGLLHGWHHDGSEIADGDQNPATHGVLFDTGSTFLYASPAVGDVDGDGLPDIVLGENSRSGPLHVIDHLGRELPAFPRVLGGQITAAAALADLDGDGRLDIVVSAESDSVFVIDGQSGGDLPGWPQPAVTQTTFARTSSPIVCDLDLDGEPEVLYAASGGRMHAWDRRGQALPGWTDVRFADLDLDATQSVPTAADVDGDQQLEVLVGAEDGRVHGWNLDGSPLAGFPLSVGGEVRGAPVIWDLDEDGLLELMAASFDRQVYVWELAGPLHAERIGWPFMRRDVRHTGRVGAPFLATDVSAESAGIGAAAPRRLALAPALPNPTTAGAVLRFVLPAGRRRGVRLELYDVHGRLVRRLVDAPLAGGMHRLGWDGRDQEGRRLAAGVYFVRLASTGEVRTTKLTVLR
jgi:hypothetical protein